ncbi:MAG: phosphate signaling complex protein PhoU [Firmicutes bacterium]|nr:phosphate signaling complex protein PhoU [Bacillota bacterium]MBR7148568.1 phosphate signaling complex protein PhoU [Bacillota bacterium]
MTRNRFNQQLAELNMGLVHMGQLCEEAIGAAVEALSTQDESIAREAISLEKIIDEKEREIQALCLRLLMQQQPVASDLRIISSAMKMITDMERIGDQAADIAEIVIPLVEKEQFTEPRYIEEMAVATRKMVVSSVNAYVDRNVELAREVIAMDDAVDEKFAKVIGKLTKAIAEHPEQGELALELLMIAKYLERIGDHATNVAEWVVYSITGDHPDAKV